MIVIISPALIILLDFDLIIVPTCIVYTLGLQWAWQFNLNFLPLDLGFNAYCDHYIISLKSFKFILIKIKTNYLILINKYPKTSLWILNNNWLPVFTRYLFDISQYILLPIHSFIRIIVYSFDVIHTLGFYSFGIKIDAIPGRVNIATTLRLLWKGEYRGKCFELCGQGHLSMNLIVLGT